MCCGIVFLIITGLLLAGSAGIFRHVFRERINIMFVVGFTAFLCMSCCLPVMAVLERPSFPWGVHMLAFAALFIAGALATAVVYFLDRVYKCGGRRIIRWGILLSCLVPFLMGIIFFDEAPQLLLLLSLPLLAVGPPQQEKTTLQKGGLGAAFFAFSFAPLAQCMFSLPSYMEQAELVSDSFRTFYFCTGVFTGAVFLAIRKRELLDSRKCFIPSLLMTAFTLLACGLFVFNGMNRLTSFETGLIAFPLMTGSGFVGFHLFRYIGLKEKVRPLQAAGLILWVCALSIWLISICF